MKFLSILSLLCMLTLSAHASSQKVVNKGDYSSFLLEAHKEKSGAMWYKGKPYLYSEFNITIANTEKAPKSFPSGICIILFDKNSDNQVLASGIDLNLLDSYKPDESKSGKIIFRSKNPDIESLRFIKLSNQECHSSEKSFIITP